MATLTTDEFYEIDFLALSSAAWTSLVTFPTMLPRLMQSLVLGDLVTVYCSDATHSPNQLEIEGGGTVYLNPAVIDTATLLTKVDAVDEQGTPFKVAQASTGTRRFMLAGGIVHSFDTTEATLLSGGFAP